MKTNPYNFARRSDADEILPASHEEFGIDVSKWVTRAAPTLPDLLRRAAEHLEALATERKGLANAALHRGDPRPMLGLVEAASRDAVRAVAALACAHAEADRVGGAEDFVILVGGLSSWDVTVAELEAVALRLRREAADARERDTLPSPSMESVEVGS